MNLELPPLACLEPDYKVLAKDIVDRYPEEVVTYKLNENGILGFFMSIVMREQRGSINPSFIKDALIKELNSR